LERRGAAAEEGSFANAGLVAPGYLSGWTAPGMPGAVLSQLWRRHAALSLHWPCSATDLSWAWQWSGAQAPPAYLAQRAQLQALACYSQQRLHQISTDLKIEYERSAGLMVLLRSEKDSHSTQSGLQLLRDSGVKFQELDATAARKIEPALNPDTALFGAIYLSDDEVSNCRQFALMLKNQAQRMGVNFLFNTDVAKIAASTSAGAALQIKGDNAPRHFDALVLCAGMASARLLAPLGLKIPLATVHGYCVSANVREPLNAPRSAVIDQRHVNIISRLGKRVRVTGSAELGGNSTQKRANALRRLYQSLRDWFPGAASLQSGVQEWKGTRPVLPDGLPLLGASGHSGIWLNLGQGGNGWTLACGSARALADSLQGRSPKPEIAGLDATRLKR
jgi:D-amino-acid dehydrogenase